MAAILEGGCLCGSVRFRAKQAPLHTLACHCTFCQRMTGSSFYTEAILPFGAVEFNDGELRTYEHTSDASGKKASVHFCPACGTTIGLTFERWPELRAISRGCYDDPNAVKVTANIWTRSAQSGIALPSGIDCFSTSVVTADGRPERSLRPERPVMARSDGDAS